MILYLFVLCLLSPGYHLLLISYMVILSLLFVVEILFLITTCLPIFRHCDWFQTYLFQVFYLQFRHVSGYIHVCTPPAASNWGIVTDFTHRSTLSPVCSSHCVTDFIPICTDFTPVCTICTSDIVIVTDFIPVYTWTPICSSYIGTDFTLVCIQSAICSSDVVTGYIPVYTQCLTLLRHHYWFHTSEYLKLSPIYNSDIITDFIPAFVLSLPLDRWLTACSNWRLTQT